jgi:hypothetical protein
VIIGDRFVIFAAFGKIPGQKQRLVFGGVRFEAGFTVCDRRQILKRPVEGANQCRRSAGVADPAIDLRPGAVGQDEYRIGRADGVFLGERDAFVLIDIQRQMDDGFERLDQVGFRGRFTSGLLAKFSVLVDEFHEDRLMRFGRQAFRLLQRHRLGGIDAYRERQ